MAQRITLKDVARATGLDVSTVSYALRNEGTIAQRTRHEVQAAAARLGYVPNPTLASLAARRFRASSAIAGQPLVLVDLYHGDRRSAVVLEGATERAKELGYDLRALTRAELASRAHSPQKLYAQGVAGLLLSAPFQKGSLPDYDWNRFAVVAIGRGEAPLPFHEVNHDHFGFVESCWHQARKAGHRRIGLALFSHTPRIPDDRLRAAAGRTLLEEFTDPCDRVPLHLGDIFDKEGFLAWFYQHRPSAVIAFHIHPLFWLRAEGLECPGDFGFSTLHLGPEPWYDGIAGAETSTALLSRTAVELLDFLLRHGERGVAKDRRVLLVAPRLRHGTSLA